MGDAFYRLMSGALCMQFDDVFASHLSPYSFGMAIKRGCEVVAHGIKATLDAPSNWVVFQVDIINAFNVILCKTIFQKFQAKWGRLS
jgi:hypothetical protein